MNKVTVFSDPHIGVRRTGNTTPASQEKLQAEQLATLDRILAMDGPKVCAGDWFDRFSNSESVIAAAWSRIAETDYSLAGNHDLTAADNKVGSLKLIRDSTAWATADNIAYADFGDYGFIARQIGGAFFYGVPHVCRQDLFEKSLKEAEQDCKNEIALSDPKILMVHANYDLPWELNETSLNLTRERAEELLDTFDYILMGHDHEAKEDLDGRLIVIGNPFPTTFNELSDKRVIVFEDGKPRSETVWTAEGNSVEFAADAIPESSEAQFIRVKGEVPAADLAATTNAASRLWKNCPNLLALKLDITSDMTVDGDGPDEASVGRLPERVEAGIKDEDMKALWQEMLGRVEENHDA